MPARTVPNQILGLAGWLLVCFAAAAAGALASVNAGAFYAGLERPPWAPPGWLFGPVWTLLYAFMAVSAWLVWRAHGFARARPALALFLIQLAVNAVWTWLFFVWQRGDLAFAGIVLLWALVAGTLAAFVRLQYSAALLLLPYLAWITFAGVLTLAVWRLNPAVLG